MIIDLPGGSRVRVAVALRASSNQNKNGEEPPRFQRCHYCLFLCCYFAPLKMEAGHDLPDSGTLYDP